MAVSTVRATPRPSGLGVVAALAIGVTGLMCPRAGAQELPSGFASLPVPAAAAPAPMAAGLPPPKQQASAQPAPRAQVNPKPKQPAKTAKKRNPTERLAEFYGREFYPGFFPDFPAAEQLLAGHEDVQEEPDLEEELEGPPEEGTAAQGSSTLSRREARRLNPSRPYAPGEQRLGVLPPKAPEMWHLGAFWWRDDTPEIAGRGPYKPDMSAYEHEITHGVHLGGPENGLTWQSEDGYFSTTFHNLTQLDFREPVQQGDPLHGGFIIPRQRWYFEGKVGDYANFVTSVNRGYASFDFLDSYAEYNFNPEWLQFRVGRMKTPSQYEYIAVDEANLIGPERSLFVQSFAGNRQLGAMAHGRVLDRVFEYYIGCFNGQRRSFEDFNSSKDFFSYLDYRPFRKTDITWLKGLHLVGAYNFGDERQPLSPVAVRTMNQLSNSNAAAFVSPTILEFGPTVFENGPRSFYDFEAVYYFRSVGFLTGYQGGYQDYSVLKSLTSPFAATRVIANNEFLGVNSSIRTHVPISGWSWQGWWFVTGEEITRRRYLVEPRRPFGYYNGTLNPGAWELFTKISEIQLGNQIFTGGLVDPKLWTNQASAFEFGVNWYLNHFTKFTFDYQHTFLASPVILNESINPAANTYTKSYDLFLFRTQLFF